MSRMNSRGRRIVVFSLGVLVPLLWWLGIWLPLSGIGIPFLPTGRVLQWGYSARIPELIVRSAIPWGAVFLSVVIARSRSWRLFIGPAMLAVAIVGDAFSLCLINRAAELGLTVAEMTRMVLGVLYLDGIPAVIVMVIGLLSARRREKETSVDLIVAEGPDA